VTEIRAIFCCNRKEQTVDFASPGKKGGGGSGIKVVCRECMPAKEKPPVPWPQGTSPAKKKTMRGRRKPGEGKPGKVGCNASSPKRRPSPPKIGSSQIKVTLREGASVNLLQRSGVVRGPIRGMVGRASKLSKQIIMSDLARTTPTYLSLGIR